LFCIRLFFITKGKSSLEISRQSWPPHPSGWYIIELSTYRGKEVLVGWIDHGNRSELALLIPVTVHSLSSRNLCCVICRTCLF